jgi:hypothetical protein
MKRGGLCRKCRNAENREKFRESNPNDKPPDVLKVFLDVLDMPDVELAHYITIRTLARSALTRWKPRCWQRRRGCWFV